jgi:hypothetical protein
MRRSAEKVPVFFAIVILVFGSAVYISSGAGSVRGWTVRYAVPLYLLIPLTAALLVAQIRTIWAKSAVVVGTIGLAVLQTIQYPIFDKKLRERQIEALTKTRETVSWLQKHHVDVAIGDYWTVYYLNFDGLRSIVAVPINRPEDYFQFGRELTDRQVRTALLDPDSGHLATWAKRLEQPGRIEHINGELSAFVVDNPLDAKGVEKARAAAQ